MSKKIGIVIGNASVTSCLGINPHAERILQITGFQCPFGGQPPEPQPPSWATESSGVWLTESGYRWLLENGS